MNPVLVARLLGVLASASACGGATSVTPPPEVAPAPVPEIRVPSRVVSPDEVGTTSELLARAKLDVAASRCPEALERLGRLLQAAPRAQAVPEALYYAGLCREQLEQHEGSAKAFTELYAAHATSPFAREAAVRASRLWIYLDNYEAADDAGAAGLGFSADAHRPLDLVALHTARALAALRRDEPDDGEGEIARARVIVEKLQLDAASPLSRDVAQMFFALGELRKARSEQIRFDPMPDDFPTTFERRAQLLLDAQGAYFDVMRAEDAHWSSRAGARIGELYENLHRDVSGSPRTAAASSKHASLFEGAMRLRYLVLLQKGLVALDRTVAMADRTEERSAWAQRARETRERLTERLNAENRAIDALPYTRTDLERVLKELQKRRDAARSPSEAANPDPGG